MKNIKFSNPIHRAIYRGLEATTHENPCNILTDIIADNPTFCGNVNRYDLGVQLRMLKNAFYNDEVLKEVCINNARARVEKTGGSVKKMADFLENEVFHYYTFLEKYNLLVCQYALMMIDAGRYFTISESIDFIEDVKRLIDENLNEQFHKKARLFADYEA